MDAFRNKSGYKVTALILLTASTLAIEAQTASQPNRLLPDYSPGQHVDGKIRIWGHGGRGKDFDGSLLRSWEDEFRRYQPNVDFENRLGGNASAIGGLYTGAADLALMGREIWPTEIDAFEQVFGHKPAHAAVMTGSVDVPNHDFALVIFVHKSNPLDDLTLAQLDAIFGADHRRDPRNIRKWGELGLKGEWADKRIHPYGYEIRRDFSYFFEQAALAGSEKWNCDLQEIADQHTAARTIDAGQLILDQLAKDPYGIAISSLAYKNAETKSVALAGENGSEFYQPSRETVMQRKFPLTRTPSFYFDRTPGRAVDAKIREFISYVVSRQGQAQVVRDGRYLPLTPEFSEDIRRELQ